MSTTEGRKAKRSKKKSEPVKRRYERYPLHERVTLVHGRRRLTAYVKNIGQGGAFVRSTRPLDLEAKIKLKLEQGGDKPIELKGQVVHAESEGDNTGLGIQFDDPIDVPHKAWPFFSRVVVDNEREQLEQVRRELERQRETVQMREVELETKRLDIADAELRRRDEDKKWSEKTLKDKSAFERERIEIEKKKTLADAEIEQEKKRLAERLTAVRARELALEQSQKNVELSRAQAEADVAEKRIGLEREYKERVEHAVRELKLAKKLAQRRYDQRGQRLDEKQEQLFKADLELSRKTADLEHQTKEIAARIQRIDEIERQKEGEFRERERRAAADEREKRQQLDDALREARIAREKGAAQFAERLKELQERRAERMRGERTQSQQLTAELTLVQQKEAVLKAEIRELRGEIESSRFENERVCRELAQLMIENAEFKSHGASPMPMTEEASGRLVLLEDEVTALREKLGEAENVLALKSAVLEEIQQSDRSGPTVGDGEPVPLTARKHAPPPAVQRAPPPALIVPSPATAPEPDHDPRVRPAVSPTRHEALDGDDLQALGIRRRVARGVRQMAFRVAPQLVDVDSGE